MLLGEYIDREVRREVKEAREAMKQEVAEAIKQEVTESVTKEVTESVTKEATEAATQRLLRLINAMLADGRAEEVPRLSEKPEFLEEMLKNYQ